MLTISRTSFALMLLLGALPCAASVACSSTPDDTPTSSASSSANGSGGGSGGSGGDGGGAEGGWSKSFGNVQEQQGHALAAAPDGGALLSGRFSGTMDLGGGLLDASGGERLFVSRLTSSGDPLWSLISGGESTGIIAAQVVDAGGNTVLAGNFAGTLELGSKSVVSEGKAADVFVAKLSPGGDVLWAASLGGQSDAFANDVAFDAAGNVLVTGIFQGALKSGGEELMSQGGADIFLVTLSPDGDHVSARRFGGGGAVDSYSQLEVDAEGNVVLAGFFGGAADFGAGPVQSAGQMDLFVVKYDAAGSYVAGAAFPFEGTGYLEAFEMALGPAGSIVLAGNFGLSVDFGGGALAGGSADQNDVFVATLGPDLKHVWSKAFKGDGSDNLRALAVSAQGDIFLGGFLVDSEVDFGGGEYFSGPKSMFLAELDASGAHVGSTIYAGDNVLSALAAGEAGFMYVTGAFHEDGLDLGFGPLSHAGESDGFIAKLPAWGAGP